jgi:hypothetical protein
MGVLTETQSVGSAFTTSAVGLIALMLVYYAYNSYQWHTKYKLPPRVPGVPVFGNTLQIPALQQGPWAKDLAEKYGEMYVRCSCEETSSANSGTRNL